MFKTFTFSKSPLHAINMCKSIVAAGPFIKKHKLWSGFLDNKWVAIVSIIIAVLFSYWLLGDLTSYFYGPIDLPDNLETDITAKEALTESSKGEAISSGTRYLLLILLEVIIFHFAVKTLSILLQNPKQPTFKEFINAERRMIKLLFISFWKGVAASIVLSIVLSIIGLGQLSSTIMFFVYSYFIGYAFIDNYNEQFGLSIKQSLVQVRQHVGAATLLGIVITGLMYLPFLGAFLAPIFGAVAASLYCHEYQVQKVELQPS